MILALAASPGRGSDAPIPPADLVVRQAIIHTANEHQRIAQAMAIRHGRIIQIGNEPSVEPLIGAGTQVLDLHGLTVLPGLIDSHGHVASLGKTLVELDLTGAHSYEAVVDSVKARAARLPPRAWVEGRGWDQNRWPGHVMPTEGPLSASVSDRPVALWRVDGHTLLVNRFAMDLARITRATIDPPGGRILRDSTGAPIGVLLDNAATLVTDLMPMVRHNQQEDRLLAGLRECARYGLTMVGDAGIDGATWDAYQALQARNALPIRVYAMATEPSELADSIIAQGRVLAGDRLMLRALEVIVDGALGSRGALLSRDYSDQPGWKGIQLVPYDSLARVANRARSAGLQMRVHCIGDSAAHLTINAFEQAFLWEPYPKLRWAIEQAQVVCPDDVKRMGHLGIVASIEAAHATSDGPWVEERLGPERVKWSFAWRTFLDWKVPIANGSDFPGESPNPLLGLYASITRRDPEGRLPAEGWRPEQKLTPDEALLSFTLWGARLAFRESDLGSLEIGKQADFVVVDRDVIDGPADEIPKARVLRTVVAGQTVWEESEAGH
jgi:predicted amidohydrolase YtcJ